eukprot:gnl/MRDRNA2_/MRDRNA2_219998_c0_seq1.p1 gnl/MRDRNA2_/MRDRNA2_219998_c0~~gnl/MRDRNA2_/MRDRNA2_219998_c0_seq1.p1  ORF type:complete len:328 (-),score=46.06 gnl/MRDRNA2_/MRDRNA2_219998_c0_seq1:41-922(-)
MVSFLLVFKTQTAYNQYWAALELVDEMRALTRSLMMSIYVETDWTEKTLSSCKRFLRLILARSLIIQEFMTRTGVHVKKTKDSINDMRERIAGFTDDMECQILYPGENKNVPASESRWKHTDPVLLHFMLKLAIKDCGCQAPCMAKILTEITRLQMNFAQIDKMDKTQFPFPYAQLVKYLLVFWVFVMPITIAESCGPILTHLLSTLLTIAFFGMDMVAEVLESPFGEDPNDIDLDYVSRKAFDELCSIHYTYCTIMQDQGSTQTFVKDFVENRGRHFKDSLVSLVHWLLMER